MGINLNPLPLNPHLGDLLNEWKRKLMIDFNCHAIGSIVSFNSEQQTAKVAINYCKTAFQITPGTNVPSVLPDIKYPQLNVPVVILSGGTASLTFPIAAGDQCLVLFNDRDTDNWFKGQTSGPVNSTRLHALADGIAIVGLRQFTKPISTYSSTHAVLQNGSTQVGVGPSTINIANAGASLGGILGSFFNTVGAITPPIDLPTALTALTTIISAAETAYKATQGLLE